MYVGAAQPPNKKKKSTSQRVFLKLFAIAAPILQAAISCLRLAISDHLRYFLTSLRYPQVSPNLSYPMSWIAPTDLIDTMCSRLYGSILPSGNLT